MLDSMRSRSTSIEGVSRAEIWSPMLGLYGILVVVEWGLRSWGWGWRWKCEWDCARLRAGGNFARSRDVNLE
jgi:hypothetical protein